MPQLLQQNVATQAFGSTLQSSASLPLDTCPLSQEQVDETICEAKGSRANTRAGSRNAEGHGSSNERPTGQQSRPFFIICRQCRYVSLVHQNGAGSIVSRCVTNAGGSEDVCLARGHEGSCSAAADGRDAGSHAKQGTPRQDGSAEGKHAPAQRVSCAQACLLSVHAAFSR